MNRTFLAGITAGGLVGMAFARRWHRTAELPPLPEPRPLIPYLPPANLEEAQRVEARNAAEAWDRIALQLSAADRAMPEGE